MQIFYDELTINLQTHKPNKYLTSNIYSDAVCIFLRQGNNRSGGKKLLIIDGAITAVILCECDNVIIPRGKSTWHTFSYHYNIY